MNDIGFLLKVIHDNTQRHANRIFKPAQLTGSQVRLLKYLRDHGEEPVSQKEIEDYMDVSHPTVVGIVQRLEQKGFVKTGFCGKDKRQKYVWRTRQEEELHENMRDSHEKLTGILTANLSKEEICELQRLLLKVYDNVKGD